MKFEKDNKNKIMSSNHEPPVKKRQRIEDDEVANNKTGRAGSVSLSPNHSTSSAGSNSPSTSSSTTSVDELDHALGIHSSSSTDLLNTTNDSCKDPVSLGVVLEQDWTDFVSAVEEKQCVCGLDDATIRRPFQRYLQVDGASSAVPLHEWPSDHIVKYLSNVQLFFDIYLKQNARGTICGKFVELCECIVNTQGLNMLEDVLELCNVRTESISKNKNGSAATKYILYLSGRVISCYLIIIKEELDNKWLKKIVDNLFIFEKLNDLAIRRINFSLDIIKYIIEFKDMDEHPLEEDINEQLAVNMLPPIETNYFAQQYLPGSSNNSAVTSSIFRNLADASHTHHHHRSNVAATDCHYVTLTDSESFDTTQIKCVTVQILENKWPALVNTMRDMIQKHRDIVHAETCTLTFLSLWENIISVKANLSVVETLPFYAQLDKFELLLCSHLSPIIYKQMLALFNEALCYGSTLALQDILPEETCNLAHHIVRHVRDFRILDYLPRQRQASCDPISVGFAGQSAPTIEYAPNTLDMSSSAAVSEAQTSPPPPPTLATYDKTLLQKLTLLVLKSVAVSVKQIRSDSSDSSIDSQDYEALQDMIVIERSIRDVLTRLETFMKNALEFHPESHFSKILIHLFADQDDYLIEAMVCTLDVTASISFRNNAFPELVAMLNPVYTFLEFLNMISNSSDLLLDLLVSNETCFLLYLLRYLKYIRLNWSMFVQSCQDARFGNNCLDETMSVLIRLRLKISRLVSKSLYPYDISPILRLLESCESLYEGNELS
ncbi:protein lines [Culicoides brevitarsis]|uniref:protein lines n=1 Tax=Culicoides brevitarsis TaxID=469753 RepID=UPI00307B3453